MGPKIVSIVGKSGSGKTTLLEKLIPELKSRGYHLGIIKHAHRGFDMDKQGKDSWRHKKAGADATLVISPGMIAMVKDEKITSLHGVTHYLSDMDLIIVEGFKRETIPKIEIFRKADRHKEPLFLDGSRLEAFVSDTDFHPGVPTFGLEEIKPLADFIENRFINNR